MTKEARPTWIKGTIADRRMRRDGSECIVGFFEVAMEPLANESLGVSYQALRRYVVSMGAFGDNPGIRLSQHHERPEFINTDTTFSHYVNYRLTREDDIPGWPGIIT